MFDACCDGGLAGGGSLAVLRNSDGAIIGHTRFDHFDADDGGLVEIGWTFLSPACWGRGLNSEMKRAMLAHAFGDVATVQFRVGDTNYRSRNALEAIGAERTERYELGRYQGRRVVHLIYRITREAFGNGPLA